MTKERIFDVIPIYENEMYPTKDEIWHYKCERHTEIGEGELYSLFSTIKRKFSNCKVVIILERGMVIKVLW